jgi:hypothetical protein
MQPTHPHTSRVTTTRPSTPASFCEGDRDSGALPGCNTPGSPVPKIAKSMQTPEARARRRVAMLSLL